MNTHLHIPRVPTATKYNRIEYCSAYMQRWGGTAGNALRAWRVDLLAETKKDLSRPFPNEQSNKVTQ